MLVLSRRQGQQIVIGDCVTISVVRIRGSVVRIGIETCKPMEIHRVDPLDGKPIHPPARELSPHPLPEQD